MIYVLVFFSGFAGLVYEIVWIKRAALAFGSSSLALSTVLAVFFLGLGLGSYGFGRLSRKVKQPLLWCAALEILLAMNGLLNPWLFQWAEHVFGLVYAEYALDSAALLGLRGVLTALLLLPPTLLMGGTLPLFCRQLIHDRLRISAKIGYIYGINTLGAAMGCAAAGFALIPWFGVAVSTYVAALINILLGLGFYTLVRRGSPLPIREISTCEPQPTSRMSATAQANDIATWGFYAVVGLLFFLIGAVALANELVWARFLTNFIRNSVYTYTITLTVVLVGTVIGSLWAGPRYDKQCEIKSLFLDFAKLQSASALLVLVLTHLPVIAWLYLKQYGVFPYMLLMLPPATIAGACFPLVNRLINEDPQHAARHVGQLTAVNILGCIVGSLVTGFLLLPQYGLDVSIYVTTGVALAASLIAMAMAIFKDSKSAVAKGIKLAGRQSLASMAFVGSCVMLWLLMPALSPVRVPNDFIAAPGTLVDFAEGYNSTLAVIRRGDAKIMLVTQLWQGTSKKNHQIMVAHTPMMHYPEAKDVLVIGLGVGQTASRFLKYPVNRLDIVDIEPRLFEFVRNNFDSAWMMDKRVSLIPEDGRGYVKHSGRQYDLLSVEVGQLYRPGVDVFYTAEFYQEAKARLTADGMIVQFVPIEFLREAEFASIINTFLSEFPQARLWFNGNELLLMGFKSTIPVLSPDSFAAAVERNQLQDDLSYAYWGGPKYALHRFPVFLGGFLAEGAELRDLAQLPGSTIYTDDLPKLAYQVSDFNETDARAAQLQPVIAQHLSPFSRVMQTFVGADSLVAEAGSVRRLNLGDMTAANLLELLETEQLQAHPAAGIEKLRAVLAANPDNLVGLRIMGELLVRQQRDAEALPYLRQVLELDEQDDVANQKMGLALLRSRQLAEAIPYLEKALQEKPNEAETLNSLAVALINLNRVAEATGYFRRAAMLEPGNVAAQRNLQNAERMLRQQVH